MLPPQQWSWFHDQNAALTPGCPRHPRPRCPAALLPSADSANSWAERQLHMATTADHALPPLELQVRGLAWRVRCCFRRMCVCVCVKWCMQGWKHWQKVAAFFVCEMVHAGTDALQELRVRCP